jgi:hypothetical protein
LLSLGGDGSTEAENSFVFFFVTVEPRGGGRSDILAVSLLSAAARRCQLDALPVTPTLLATSGEGENFLSAASISLKMGEEIILRKKM